MLCEGLSTGKLNSQPGSWAEPVGPQKFWSISGALCAERLTIADEPTTALDVTTQLAILRLFDQMHRERQVGLLFVTHDLPVARTLCEQVAVLYAREAVESGQLAAILDARSIRTHLHCSRRFLRCRHPRLPCSYSRSAIHGQVGLQRLFLCGALSDRGCVADARCHNEHPPLIQPDPERRLLEAWINSRNDFRQELV
jgi:ABC-type dipeptide/oligopeptide/nickel transport system ATPase component